MTALLDCAIGISDDGITKLPTVADLSMKDSHWQGGVVARGVHGDWSEASHEIDVMFSSGQRRLRDYSRRFTGCFDGFQYYVIFICRRSLFIRIYPLRDKSAVTIITEALEPLRVFVATVHPGTYLQSLYGDSDSAVSQWGHGEHQDTLPLRTHNANLANPILVALKSRLLFFFRAGERSARNFFFRGGSRGGLCGGLFLDGTFP